MEIIKKVFISILFIGGCVPSNADNNAKYDNIIVNTVGYDEGGEFCQAFTLSAKKVNAFFTKSTCVKFKKIHDEYDYLPCYVKGTLKYTTTKSAYCTFTIRAGGTSNLSCDNNKYYYFACRDCDELLGEENVEGKK